MTYRDMLMEKSSALLYHTLYVYVTGGGDLEPEEMTVFEAVGEELSEDETHHDQLVDIVERLHDDDLLTLP